MAERLPFGQVTPVARPLDSFIQPSAQQGLAKPATPSEIQVSGGLRAIETGNGGNIASQADPGRNLRAVAEALTPFNRALTTTLTGGAVMLKAQQIDAGYIEAQNEYAKAQLILQQQSEVSATNAASQITQLEKVDPVAAILLKDANPWKQIGRRRAIAQIAGSDVNSALSAALSQDFGRLAGLPPGSGELMKVRVNVTDQVMQRYGLTEDMPEVAQYFTPQMTRAWDKFATKHEQAYNDQLEASTVATGTAALGSGLQSMYQGGIPFNGTQVMPGDPLWPQLAGVMLTQELDKQLQMLGGSSRVNGAKEIREQLMGAYGQVPVMAEALTFVRGGDPSVPMEKRPAWGASNPLDMLELKNRGNEARIKDYELGQQGIEQKLDALWYQAGSPGALLPSDPGYPAALITFRNQAAALGYRDVDSYLSNRMSATSSVMEEAYRPDPLASQDFLNAIEDAPPSTFSSPAGLKALREQAAAAAKAEPTPALQAERYREYSEAIERKRKQAEEFTPGVKQQIDQALLQDLALPKVKELADKGKPGGSSMMQALIQQGADPASAAASAFGSSNVVAFTNGVQNLYLRAAEDALNQWREDNPGRAMSPAAKNRIVSQAVADARKSKDYADLYSTLTGMQPGQVGQGTVGTGPSQGTQPGPQARGVPKASASSLPDSTVKGYAARPVLDGSWLHSELSNVANGKPVSAELYQLAKRAGTSTNRYLLEQLRFYPQLDPQGEARQFLEGQLRKQRQGQQLSSANYSGATGGLAMVPTGYNPLAPGSWLMNLLMPPAAAGTLPTPPPISVARASGSGGGGTPPGAVGAFRAAIIGKESGGNYSAVNPDSGALGIGQVMPDNVGPWTQKYLGRRLTPQQFLRDRNAQDTVINGRFRDMLADQEKAGFSGEQAIRRAAAVWYSGQAKLWNDTRPQYSNGRRYPSIAEYTQAIWESYKRNGGEVGRRSAAEPDSGLADQLVSQLGNEKGYEDVAGPGAQRKPWAASPGEFADKGSFQNGLDAINKAGASIIGFLGGNANDIELVRRFYTKNPQVPNQYDLPVNLFLRYMAGIGAKGLSVSQEQGLKIIDSIKNRRQDSPEAIKWAEQNMPPAAAASYKRQIAKGMIPVYSYAVDDKEVGNSLGRFWAEPQKDGSFVITEDFNFGYAPSSKGGDNKRAKLLGMANPLTIDPMQQANRLVAGGHGTPFRYRLRVYPDGRVQVLSPSK
jgi:hypothetical protein